MKENEIDRSKLKCFNDINMFNNSFPGFRRRNTPIKNYFVVQRNPNNTESQFQRPSIFSFLKYRCVRDSSTNLRGYRVNFQFFFGDVPIFHAKVKPHSNTNYIGISEGTSSHIKPPHIATILHANSFCDFSFRNGDSFGKEVFSVQFRNDETIKSKPRRLIVHFFGLDDDIPQTLSNEEPSLDDEGRWIIDLHSSQAIGSIKNARMIDEKRHPYIFIRKIDKDVLEIEAAPTFEEVWLFAMTICDFLCKL